VSNIGDDAGVLWKVSIAVWTGFAGALAWILGRLDKKVSHEVFSEYKEKNDLAHGMTHSTLKEIKEGQDKIWEKMDGKKDKHD